MWGRHSGATRWNATRDVASSVPANRGGAAADWIRMEFDRYGRAGGPRGWDGELPGSSGVAGKRPRTLGYEALGSMGPRSASPTFNDGREAAGVPWQTGAEWTHDPRTAAALLGADRDGDSTGRASGAATATLGQTSGQTSAPPLGASFEAELLAVLERPVKAGDSDGAQARLIEFEGLLLHLSEELAAALYARLGPVPAPSHDRLAKAFERAFIRGHRARIVARLAAVAADYRPVRVAESGASGSAGRLWAHMAPGEKSWDCRVMGRVDAPDGVVLRSRPFGDKDGPTLPFDTLVMTQRETEKGWYYVTALGDSDHGDAPTGMGFIENYHVATGPPDPTAHLYLVQPGDMLKDIAAKYYGHGFGWGHDARLYVQAMYHANAERDVVFRQNADLSVDRRALSTKNRDEALALWKQARVVSGQGLWMPSEAFVMRLKDSGAIHHASLSREMFDGAVDFVQSAIDWAQYAGGFAMGLLEGAFGALEDLFEGVADLVRAVWAVARALIGDFSAIKKFARQLSEAWANREALAAAVSEEFMTRWFARDDWDRGNFQGEVLGYVMMLAFIMMATMGAASAAAGTGRFGNFVKLIEFADAAGSMMTYVGKLGAVVRLPGKVLDRASEVIRKRVGGGEMSAQARPQRGNVEWDTGNSNHGAPYTDPRETPHLPRRRLKKKEMAKAVDLQPAQSWREARRRLRDAHGVPLGEVLRRAKVGHEVIASLARGDASVLRKIGIDDYPRDLDPSGREWGLVQTRRGYLIYAGKYGGLEFPGGVRAIAHNHPGPAPTAAMGVGRTLPTEALPVPTGQPGLTFHDLTANWKRAMDTGITPSARDIHAITDGSRHVIYTRYVHRGAGKIDNPGDVDTAPRIELHLSDAKVLRWRKRSKEFYYSVDVTVCDTAGKKLWAGPMYVNWFAHSKQGDIFVKKPAVLNRPVRPGSDWSET